MLKTKSKTKAGDIFFVVLGIIGVSCIVLAKMFPKNHDTSDDRQLSTPIQPAKESSTSFKRTIYVDHYPTTIDLTIPVGYEEGPTCTVCSGSGVEMGLNGVDETICASCMGKGFNWQKKSGY